MIIFFSLSVPRVSKHKEDMTQLHTYMVGNECQRDKPEQVDKQR